MMADKMREWTAEKRREVIREVLKPGPFTGTQKELVAAVQERAKGHDDLQSLVQSTISRDLRTMGITDRKRPGGPYMLPETERVPGAMEGLEQLGEYAVRVIPRAAPIFVQTDPGFAQVTSTFVRRAFPDSVVGTLVGEDTVLVFTLPESSAGVFHKLSAALGVTAALDQQTPGDQTEAEQPEVEQPEVEQFGVEQTVGDGALLHEQAAPPGEAEGTNGRAGAVEQPAASSAAAGGQGASTGQTVGAEQANNKQTTGEAADKQAEEKQVPVELTTGEQVTDEQVTAEQVKDKP